MSTIAGVATYSASLNGEVSDIVGGSGQGDDHVPPKFKVISTSYPVWVAHSATNASMPPAFDQCTGMRTICSRISG